MMLDALYVNGRFHTLDPARPQAHALGVFGGLIVGLDEEVEGLPTERLVDLGGAPVVPGFHDAHHHLSARGHALVFCDVSPAAAQTLEALYAAVARHAATLGPNDWLRGSGYVDSVLGGHPTREALDAVTGGRPAFLSHASGHGGVVNSEAVRRVSGDPDRFPDVDAGFVERRGDGSLTGFIAERAVEPVSALLRPQPLEAHVHAIGLASRAALADGLTSVTEPGISGKLTGNGPGDLAAFQLARDRGLLSVRTTVMPEFPALHPVAKAESDLPGFGLDLGLRSGLGDDWLRVGGVKLFGDGALSARTAALSCAYHGETGTGLLHQDAETLKEQIVAAHLAGWQVATHAIGDRAVAAALDGYEAAQAARPRPGARHRIEHCGMADDQAVARIAALGLVPVPQGPFLPVQGDVYTAAVGPDREHLLYRQRSFLMAGVEVPGSSDCPVVNGAPLYGIAALVQRLTPDGRVLGPQERLTVAQALRAYTFGSAYAEHSETRKGSLSRGKLADFVVLSDDLLAVAQDRIADLEIQATVVGGRALHGEDNLAVR